MESQAELNESSNHCYIVFQVLKVHLVTFFVCCFFFSIQSTGLLVLIVLHQFLHQPISFFTTFKNFIQHFLKQDFFMNFFLLTDLITQAPTPIPLMAKIR